MRKWYYNTWILAILYLIGGIGSIFLIGLPFLVLGIVLTALKNKNEKVIDPVEFSKYQEYIQLNNNYDSIKKDTQSYQTKYDEIVQKTKDDATYQASIIAEKRKSELDAIVLEKENEISSLDEKIINKEKIFEDYFKDAKEKADENIKEIIDNQYKLQEELKLKVESLEKINKQLSTNEKKLEKVKTLYRASENTLRNYTNLSLQNSDLILPEPISDELEDLSPTVIIKLNCMDVKELRKSFKENDKLIEQIMLTYSSRYNTKSNAAIYKLMVMALKAELQNILYNMRYEKLEIATDQVKEMITKYLKIASDGNQSIAPTLVKFIGEIESLFITAVNIEYEYYMKKEQARSEQMAIREQMRQELAEKKELEKQRAQVEAEESKYLSEIEKIKGQMASASDDVLKALNEKINKLQSQLDEVEHKKEEIVNLQNGKAGSVYVISNLGAFGEKVFKVGMTRRLDPLDRIKELGSASVPFRFDVHSMIFSEDAVNLENKLHTLLSDKRVNKVNSRKEFFYSTIDELEELVNRIEPTAAFKKTMLAEEFRQTESLTANIAS
ncbi:MAG: GIY-YIG nuclease family protein [Eubacterium sp.]